MTTALPWWEQAAKAGGCGQGGAAGVLNWFVWRKSLQPVRTSPVHGIPTHHLMPSLDTLGEFRAPAMPPLPKGAALRGFSLSISFGNP